MKISKDPKDNTNRHFKGQQKDEVVLCFTRKHWIVLVPHFLGFIVFLICVVGFFFFFPSSILTNTMTTLIYRIFMFIIILMVTIYIHHFFLRSINYFLQTLIVTNFRVLQLDQTLYFSNNRDSVDLSEIQDLIVLQKGIMKTIFNYGEIEIILSSVHATKILTYIPNPEYYFRKIGKTKMEYINRMAAQAGVVRPPPTTV